MRSGLTLCVLAVFLSNNLIAQGNTHISAEGIQVEYLDQDSIFFRSATVDFVRIRSTKTENVQIAIVVFKPAKPSPVLLLSHGWHGSVSKPKPNADNPHSQFLTIEVDMRGRTYSTGKQDCNGYELYDFYDAYRYALVHYRDLISDPDQVYLRGESGGGGNGFGLVGKFPDLFCSAVINCGPSDYELWYRCDSVGEFRDEMVPWIGVTPDENPEAYASRSGITTVANVLTPSYVCHGELDKRVPAEHSRRYYDIAKRMNKPVRYLELKGVGDERHWGNITDEQNTQKHQFEQEALARHEVPVLPLSGRLFVAGFLVTKTFLVFMNSVDDIGIIDYDLGRHRVEFVIGEGVVEWAR